MGWAQKDIAVVEQAKLALSAVRSASYNLKVIVDRVEHGEKRDAMVKHLHSATQSVDEVERVLQR